MKISNPELNVVRFGADDVIATSGWIHGALTGQSGSFYIPAGQYGGGTYSGNFVEFSGTFGNYNGSEYEINDVSGATSILDSDRAGLMTTAPLYVYPDTGVPVPAGVRGGIAQQYYDAYSYGGGYYSDGQSYYDIYWQ